MLASDSDVISITVCSPLHTYVPYPIAERKKVSNLLSAEKVAITAFSIIVQQGY